MWQVCWKHCAQQISRHLSHWAVETSPPGVLTSVQVSMIRLGQGPARFSVAVLKDGVKGGKNGETFFGDDP